jgi:undecaprenyl-diphosphatase
MTWLQATVLGFVQGLTEFLPISSSAHLRIVAALAGWSDPGAVFTAVTQLGTETAVLIYFRRDIAATIPIAVLGLLLQHPIETAFRDLRILAATLIGFGLILGGVDRVARNTRTLADMTRNHALLTGLAQALALVPGVSRSGGTISAALLLGYRRDAAARYSFLLAIPAVLASGALELTKLSDVPAPSWAPTLLATAIAFATGYGAIAWFLRYITTHRFTGFVIYRVLLGAAVLTLVTVGALTP